MRAGISERVAVDISGHKTRTIFDRYDIVDESDLRIAKAKLDELKFSESVARPVNVH